MSDLPTTPINFEDTATAFAGKNNEELKNAYNLFRLMQHEHLVNIGGRFTELAFKIGLPISYPIRLTIFEQFCGGETVEECKKPVRKLSKHGVHTILDYGVEAKQDEEELDLIAVTLNRNLELAKEDPDINIVSSKITGLVRFDLLEKVSSDNELTVDEEKEWERAKARVYSVSKTASDCDIQIYYDAEESWIQPAIDEIVMSHAAIFNKEKPIIFNTIQLYRHDRLEYLKELHKTAKKEGYILAVKLVRGAYMEKERARAKRLGYDSPIQPDKEATDRDYNAGLTYCVEHMDTIAFCNATHNQESCGLLAEMVQVKSTPNDHPHIFSSQLFGMSDHLSFNMAAAGFNVAKYMPYGPVKEVIPYLIRRAKENTSVNGQVGRELNLLKAEMERRDLIEVSEEEE